MHEIIVVPMTEVTNMDVKQPKVLGEKIHKPFVITALTEEVGMMVVTSAKDETDTTHKLMTKGISMDAKPPREAIYKIVNDTDTIEAIEKVGMMEAESANAIHLVKGVDIN